MKEWGYIIICYIIGIALIFAGMSLMMHIEYTGWLGMPTYPYQTQGVILILIGVIFCAIGFYYIYKWQRRKAVEIIAEGVKKAKEK